MSESREERKVEADDGAASTVEDNREDKIHADELTEHRVDLHHQEMIHAAIDTLRGKQDAEAGSEEDRD